MVNRQAKLDATFAALADPTRRAIVARLARGDTSVGELARPFAMSGPAISKHLRVLERAGLLRQRRQGRVRRCRLQPAPLQFAARWIEQYRFYWTRRLDALATFLESTTLGTKFEPPGRALPATQAARWGHRKGQPQRTPSTQRGISGSADFRASGEEFAGFQSNPMSEPVNQEN